MALKKDRKKMKKGVDKGRGVWYISKALEAREHCGSGAVEKHSRESKKGLDKPREA